MGAVSGAIDLMHMGRDRVICAFEEDGLIVDPGPGSCVDTLLAGLGATEPRALLLTHVHLDHAGASGILCRRFPELRVYVHERGAPHLVDPAKLLASTARLYGDRMDELWGEMAPVPEERIHVLSGGETVEGMRVAYTPGHASHHVCFLDEGSGDAYVGDVAGVRIPPSRLTVAPTPPPDIDVEAWLDSLDLVAGWEPSRLCLTHFGAVDDVAEQIERTRGALTDAAESARDHSEEEFTAAMEARLARETDEDTARSFLQAAAPDQQYAGLSRYWRKRAEAA